MDNNTLELLNKIIKINIESLNDGKYFNKDNNFYNNIDLIINMFDNYLELLEKININNYLKYKYNPVYLNKNDIKKICYDVFNYIDNITENKYNFYNRFTIVSKLGIFNISENNKEWNTTSKELTYKINGKLDYSIVDVISIIHEFFHLDYVNLGKIDNVKSMSENISIYFETLAIKYLLNNEMFYDGLIQSYLKRLTNNINNIEKNYIELIIIKIYKKYGNITQKLIEDLDMKEIIIEFINNHIDNPQIEVFDTYPYILGILISNNLLFSKYNTNKEVLELLKIYDNINSYDFNDILEKLHYFEFDIDNVSQNIREFLNKNIYKRLKRSISQNENRNRYR